MTSISNVKLSKKCILEELQAKLLLMHQRLTQQELLDKIIEYAQQHFNDFVREQIIPMRLTKEKIRRIKNAIYTGDIAQPSISNDDLIYGERE